MYTAQVAIRGDLKLFGDFPKGDKWFKKISAAVFFFFFFFIYISEPSTRDVQKLNVKKEKKKT